MEKTEPVIRFNFEQIHKILPYLIITVGTILGLYLLSPLAKEGVPMNIDLPFHYGRIACFEKNPMWSLPTFWCPQSQAGIASFQAYALVPFHFTSILSWIMPLSLAFKIMLALIFFLLPIGAFLLLKRLQMPLAGAIAFLLLVVEHGSWHRGGFDKLFIVGLFSNALGSAMLLITLAYAITFFETPTKKNMIILSILSALFFLSHAATFMFFPLILLLLAAFYYENVKKHYKLFFGYPGLVFLLTAYWFVPFLAKMGYYVPSGGGNVKIEEIYGYLLKDMPSFIIVLGLLGLGMCLLSKRKDLRIIGIVSFIIPGLWLLGFLWPNFIYFKYIQLIRNLAEARSLLLIGVGIALGYLGKVTIRLGKLRFPTILITLLILAIITPPLVQRTIQSSSIILLSSQPEFEGMRKVYDRLETAKGRVIVEDTLFSAGTTSYSYSHPWALSPAFTNLELLGTGDNLYNKNDFSNTQKDIFMNIPLAQWPEENLTRFLNDLNVEYVVTYSQHYVNRFQKYPFAFVEEPWIVFNTGITPAYIEMRNGTVINQEYHGHSAKAKVNSSGGELLFKVREFPNWKILLDNKTVPRHQNNYGLILVAIPPGEHTITFEYWYITVDIIGYLLTGIGVIIILYIWYGTQQGNTQKIKKLPEN